MDVHVIRHAVTSPDGQWLVFNAVGYLWKKKLPDSRPERITNGLDFEFEPAFSPDGKSLAYISWNDSTMATLYKVNLSGTAKPVQVTKEKGIFRAPSFSPDGKWITYFKEGGDNVMGQTFSVRPGIYLVAANGGTPSFVSDKGEYPKFNKKGDRIYYQTGGMLFGSLNKTLGSYKLDGSDDKTILKSTYANQFTVSPDGSWVAFVDLHKVYVAAFPFTGKTIDLGSGTTDFPVKQVAKDAGINLHWSSDSKKLHYTLGNQYYTIDLADRFEFVAGKADSLFKMPDSGIAINLKLPIDKPSGLLAFTNARIITMNNDQVIENGTVLIEGNIVKAVGRKEEVSIPSNTKQINASGKTIMPGFVDAHAHANHFRYGLTPQQFWPYYANLSYGVTTIHDPSAVSEMVFAQSELVKSGKMVGPRVFSTGTILYGADGDFKATINSLEDARSALRRSKAYGAFSVKSYNQPRREQRQWIIKAARELGMEVVPEGGSFFFHNLSMINDGHTTIEHNIPIAPLYKDVVELWKESKTAYTPTLIVSYGAVSGEYYWYQHSNVWEKERLLKFTPRSVIDTRSRYRVMLPEEEYVNGHILVSQQVKKLKDAGVQINMGAHGQLQGLGAHWEIWMLTQGGMSKLDALKAATINSAKSLGIDQQIGSLQAGKLADLIVLDKNPLDDIYNTESIKYVMVNGRLYDAESMNEIGNYNKMRKEFHWELNKNADSFQWQTETVTDEHSIHCMCGKH